MAQRGARWVSHPFATWEDPADDAANIAWVRDYRAGNAPFTTGGVYLNFIGDEGEERISAAFGARSSTGSRRSRPSTTPATSSPATRTSGPRCPPDDPDPHHSDTPRRSS